MVVCMHACRQRVGTVPMMHPVSGISYSHRPGFSSWRAPSRMMRAGIAVLFAYLYVDQLPQPAGADEQRSVAQPVLTAAVMFVT